MKKILTVLTLLLVFAIAPQVTQAQAAAKPAKKETLKNAKTTKTAKDKASLKVAKKEKKKTVKKLEAADNKLDVHQKASKIPGPSKDKPAEAVVKPINRGTVNGEPIVRKKNKDKKPQQVIRKKDN